METVEKAGVKLFKFNVGPSSFLVNPQEGARLMNWYVSFADGTQRDVIYWPASAPIGGAGFADVRGGMPILFPFAGSSFVNAKPDCWKNPDGEVLPMKKHGYANCGKFEVIASSDRSFSAKFVPDAECERAFPYEYELVVTYRFSELSLLCDMSLANTGNKAVPWGAGFHPYFLLPWNRLTKRCDYRLVHDAKKAFNILPSGVFAAADPHADSFDEAGMQNLIRTNFKSGTIKFGPKNGEEDITIRIDGGGRPAKGVSVVTWSESADVPYYCVEPWLNPPNTASKPVHFAEQGEVKSFCIEISLM